MHSSVQNFCLYASLRVELFKNIIMTIRNFSFRADDVVITINNNTGTKLRVDVCT